MVYKPTRGTAAAWATSSTVLQDGQLGLARNADGTVELRFGDGTNTWPSLPRSAAERDAVKITSQSLTSGQQAQARTNLSAVGRGHLALFVEDYGAVCNGTPDDTTAIQ